METTESTPSRPPRLRPSFRPLLPASLRSCRKPWELPSGKAWKSSGAFQGSMAGARVIACSSLLARYDSRFDSCFYPPSFLPSLSLTPCLLPSLLLPSFIPFPALFGGARHVGGLGRTNRRCATQSSHFSRHGPCSSPRASATFQSPSFWFLPPTARAWGNRKCWPVLLTASWTSAFGRGPRKCQGRGITCMAFQNLDGRSLSELDERRAGRVDGSEGDEREGERNMGRGTYIGQL